MGGDARGSVTRTNLLIAATAATIGLIYGYDLGSIAAVILFLQPDFGLSDAFVGILTAAVVLGQLVGAFFGGRIANAIGRRRAVIYVAIGYAVFAAMQGLAPDPYTLTAARFLLGLAIGVSIIAAPAFIAESAPVRIRGSMLVGFQIATTSGIVIAYGVGVLLAPSESWRLILSLSAIPAVLVLALVRRLPDTPRWYLMAGRREDALRTLRETDPDQDAEAEARVIEEDLRHEERGSFRELFEGRFGNAALFVIGLGFLVQITGINAIVYYSPTIFQQVQHEPGLARAADEVKRPPLLVDHPHRLTGRAMGEDVARAHQGDHVLQGGRALGDVHHQRQLGGVGHRARPAQRLESVGAHGVAVDPGLDAEHEVAVLVDHLLTQQRVAVLEVGELAGLGHQTHRRDIQQGEHPRLGRRGDELAKPTQRQRSRRPRVEPGRHPRAPGDRIGVDAPPRGAAIDVGVKVDQAGRYIQPRGIDHLARRLRRDVAIDRRDPSTLDRHVERTGAPAAGVDDLAAADEHVEAHALAQAGPVWTCGSTPPGST